ncbi:hypothetical protein GH733_014829 [Mirounga leonina]|nr:hypothetical protein GH733_014829 [Mirounga leonina]
MAQALSNTKEFVISSITTSVQCELRGADTGMTSAHRVSGFSIAGDRGEPELGGATAGQGCTAMAIHWHSWKEIFALLTPS